MEESVERLYDEGIAACRAGDAAGAAAVLGTLLERLNFEYDEAARRLARLYDGCLRRLGAGRVGATLRLLLILRRACVPRLR